jgi:hypothetical protein
LKNYSELEELKAEEEKKNEKEENKDKIEGEYLDVMLDDKSKESAKKLIEKYIKVPFKQEDADEIKKKTNE